MYNQGYENFYPYSSFQMKPPKMGFFQNIKGFAGKTNWSGLLTGAGKTLNVINQAIPIIYQVRPIWNNAKTMFRIAGALKDDPTSAKNTKEEFNPQKKTSSSTLRSETNAPTRTIAKEGSGGSPTFFV